jgi:hypothetical protein
MTKSDMSNKKLNLELEGLKRNEQISDWSVTLGYGEAEYTLDLSRKVNIDPKLLAKKLNELYGARTFTRHVDGSNVAIKFVIDL